MTGAATTVRRVAGAARGLLVLCLASAAGADVVTIQPARDNTLFEDATGSLSDGAGPVLFAGNNGQGLARRALLRFDVAAALPPDAQVDDVALTLNVSNAPNATLREVALHRVLQDWGEGTSSTTSGAGAPATDGDATWLNTYYPSQLWGSAGGDFAAFASGSQLVGDVGSYTWTSPDMKTDVQLWHDDPTTNFGWLVKGDEVTLNTARRFDSRENTVTANRPALTIRYTSTVGVGDDRGGSRFSLLPCRPNPAVGPVHVGYVLKARARARLEIVDPAGRRVATLLDGCRESGRYEADWDGRQARGGHAAAGVYLYRLVVDGRTIATRRLVMLP